MRVVADINIPYLAGVFEPYAEVVYMKGSDITASDVVDADALIVRTRTNCDARLLEGSAVKIVATATIGTDHIDLEWCRDNDIKVVSAAGSNSGGVLQWISAALAHISDIEDWTPEQKTIGIIGVGSIGSLVKRYCEHWGFKVVCSDPPREANEQLDDSFVPLDGLIATADIITVHTPLTTAGLYPTANILSAKRLSAIKSGATIINTSRGGIADEQALAEEVSNGRLKSCIDTWINETDINRKLLRLSVISTPHIAGYSAQGKANATAMVVEEIAKELALPISNWYPAEVQPAERKLISWDDMCATIHSYFNIAGESDLLKSSPHTFETAREQYNYRKEYF